MNIPKATSSPDQNAFFRTEVPVYLSPGVNKNNLF